MTSPGRCRAAKSCQPTAQGRPGSHGTDGNSRSKLVEVTVHELSRGDARRIAVRAQLLDGSRPAGLLDVVRRLTRPAGDLALYRADMARWDEAERGELPGWRASLRDWVRANDACRRDILDRLGSSGPLPSRALPDACVVPWKSSGWINNKNVSQLLEFMVLRGEVAVAGRRGGDRLWDLASRVYPVTRWFPRTRRGVSATSGGCGPWASDGQARRPRRPQGGDAAGPRDPLGRPVLPGRDGGRGRGDRGPGAVARARRRAVTRRPPRRRPSCSWRRRP
jgi:hypothetical protein